jgi:glutaminase
VSDEHAAADSQAYRDRFVSSGRLPGRSAVAELVATAYQRFLPEAGGSVSDVYPALALADPSAFGLCVCAADGDMVEAGDSRVPFTLMSVAKPFVFALVCARTGLDAVRELVGLNATGRPFNSIEAVERGAGGRTNPMVNPGAIATTSLTPGTGVSQRWAMLHEGLSRFAGRTLALDESTLDSALATNHRNRALANLLASFGSVHGDPDEAVQLYTRQSCLAVTAVDLAVMGTTLASGGVNPLTHERVVDAETAHHTLAVMTIAGLYETSGDWLIDIGVPGKSGIGGGIVTVSPGKGALGTYSPLLDPAGNSVRGQLAARFLSRGLGLDVFAADGGRAPEHE